MNFNKRKEPQIETPPPRIDFAKLAEEIENETTPRVSEYAPAPLRERIEAASRLSMQEMANACCRCCGDSGREPPVFAGSKRAPKRSPSCARTASTIGVSNPGLNGPGRS